MKTIFKKIPAKYRSIHKLSFIKTSSDTIQIKNIILFVKNIFLN